MTPLRILDKSVTEKWDFEKQVEYADSIYQILHYLDKIGKKTTIEYVDEDLNVIRTITFDSKWSSD